jgi:ankyrin repeat protein
MPVRRLASPPNLVQLKYQAKDLLKALAAHDRAAAQRAREFHPRLQKKTDADIFQLPLRLSDAQLMIAREYGFASWMALKRHIEKPTAVAKGNLSLYEQIEDPTFLQGVELIDHGNVTGLRTHLRNHPALVHQRVLFEGRNYFSNPTLLEFVAENPIRRDTLPENIVEVAQVLLDAGAKEDLSALNETLGLVCSGKVARECGQQLPLVELLCSYGADPDSAVLAALTNGEFEAVESLIEKGARVDLPVAAATGRIEKARELLSKASSEDRHRALALASQFGRAQIVRMLLDDGQDPDRYNPLGTHSHSTPLHQAAVAGHMDVVRLLVEAGASLTLRDTLWNGTAAGWAEHAGNSEVESYLLSRPPASPTRRE